MRLWSTVVTHDANRPRRQSARYDSALAATCRRLGNVVLQVLLERAELLVRPAPPDGWHVARDRRDPVLTVEQEGAEALRRRQDRAVRDRWAIPTLPLRAVALGADAFPFAAAELLRRSVVHPRVVLRLWLGEDAGLHLRVESAAELPPAPSIRAGAL